MALIKLIMKERDCRHLSSRQLEYEEKLTVFNKSYQSSLVQATSPLSVKIPESFDARLNYLRRATMGTVNVGKHYVFYLLVLVFAVAMGLLMPVIVKFVLSHVPQDDDLDYVSSTPLLSVLGKIHHRCFPIGGNKRGI
ncbi:OLC1v1020003C1 [Oldenlandia corymbosa var. corymbosa]|uniref:OLC1v1020003C1 n=1 Tax=Oldenlandia corymbosa var. corymbosa TaxID=529605 RepID=A0AAV1EFA4_OLDCO|nr:OLC1v1020003C1 [Oldenlandia corymbosa var. corymbosa]